MIDDIEKETRFTLYDSGRGSYQVITPLTFRDGDVIYFYISINPDGSYFLTDGGVTLFHFSSMGADYTDRMVHRSNRFFEDYYQNISIQEGCIVCNGKGNPAFAIPDYTAAILALELKWREWYGFFN